MANNAIKGFMVSGTPRYLDAKYVDGREISGDVLDKLATGILNGLYVNGKNNLEINSAVVGAEKLNLVAGQAIQIKPGLEEGKPEPIQLDNEQHGIDATELTIKVCNGAQPSGTRVVGLKVNAAEVVLDNQKNNTTEFDTDSIDLKVRRDKWNSGQSLSDGTGPIYLKAKARAFDFRCYGHGGIALQVAGADSHGKENKIKFESDRITEPGASASYCGEGGKGLEFGTFNNLHTSLYTGDYRFKGDATVYGVTRNAPAQTSTGKIDYPTQGDDFKDVVDTANGATWNEIISGAKKCRDLDETIAAAVARASVSGVDMSVFVTKTEVEDVVASAMSAAHIDTTGLATEQWVLDRHYIAADANEIVFEKKISKNGDRSGQDTEFVYSYSNNVSNPEKVADFAAFKANYDSKHKNHGKTDEELQAMYDAFLAEGTTYEVRVKVSELLGLVQRVADLEARLAALEGGASSN